MTAVVWRETDVPIITMHNVQNTDNVCRTGAAWCLGYIVGIVIDHHATASCRRSVTLDVY